MSAASALKALAPSCNIIEYNEFLTSENARALVRNFDCILDCTDNAGLATSRAVFVSYSNDSFLRNAMFAFGRVRS
jgi:molybdopterin/thiamine biosynthesis adenylyltransferase